MTIPRPRFMCFEGNLVFKSTNGAVVFSYLWAIPGFTQKKLILIWIVKPTLRSSIWFEKKMWRGLVKNILFIYDLHTFPFCKETRSSFFSPC